MHGRVHQNCSGVTRLRVLLVDDDCDRPSAIRRMLSESEFREFEFSCVSTLAGAVNKFQANGHDICIIDSTERRFADFLEQAKRVGCQTPMIVVTSDDSQQILEAFHAGAQDCHLRERLTGHHLEESICKVVLDNRLARSRLENEQRYLSLLQQTDDIIYTHDLAGNYTSANGAAERVTGYSIEAILGLNVRQVVAREFISLSQGMIDRKLDQQKTTSYELEILDNEGRRVALSISSHLIYSAGKPVAVQGIARRK